jgi:hypothetical protein
MPTQSLLIGPVQSMLQNTFYAMPARACKINTSAANLMGALVSTTTTGAVAITVTAGEAVTSAPFIYCTTSAPTIRLVAL